MSVNKSTVYSEFIFQLTVLQFDTSPKRGRAHFDLVASAISLIATRSYSRPDDLHSRRSRIGKVSLKVP